MRSKTKLEFAYFGSPDFSAYFLEKVLNDINLKKLTKVKLVVTQPNRPVGRKQILTETPVKKIAKSYGIEIFEINNFKSFKNLKLKIKNFDLCLVYAFSQIIPKDFLKIPNLGFWNIHPSLLPKYRGPSPIAYSLIFGEKETGVTIIKMDEKIDHGPIIAQEKLKIEDKDHRLDLEKKLTDLGFKIFYHVILNLFQDLKTKYESFNWKNKIKLISQNHSQATYTRLLKKQDGFIHLSTLKKALKNESLKFEELPPILKEMGNWKLEIGNSSQIIYNYFRGLHPWPGIWTLLPNGKRLKIIDMNFDVIRYTLHVIRVQLEGKKEVDFKIFNQAYKVF